MRILVADDTALASFVKKGLEPEHYAVDNFGKAYGDAYRNLVSRV
jgi:DNA-binding response OmpR family regulator